MAELLSPGVFIEEIPSQVQVIQGVSTSNLGIVGFTTKGPTDEATLVTSFEQFSRIFGDLSNDSVLPLGMAAYFANGGQRAYVVRVVPGDAVAADAKIQSATYDQAMDTGDGTTTSFSETSSTTTLKVNDGASPIVPLQVTFRWREADTPVALTQCVERDGTTALVGDASTLVFEGRIDPATLPTIAADFDGIDEALLAIVPDTSAAATQLEWQVSSSSTTLDFTSVSADGRTMTGTNAGGSTATLDLVTGIWTATFHSSEVPDAAAIQFKMTPATATKSCTDSAVAGTLAGDVSAGMIDYDDGSWSFTASVAPHDGSPILCDYLIEAWDLDPISEGAWGNDLRVTVSGNVDNYTAATGLYTKWDVNVWLYNSSLQGYSVVEQYEELDFTDSTSTRYFPDVLNDLSDYFDVVEPGGDEAPGQLETASHTRVLAGGGDGTNTGLALIQESLGEAPVQPRTVTITYTYGGDTKTITDDGSGNLTGDVDAAGTNTITYASGAIDVTLANAPDDNTFVTATYYNAPAESTHTEDFGDQTKYTWTGAAAALWTQGDDGTFDSTNYGRNQFTSPTLQATYQGLFALSKIREIMQIVIPDFVGDTTITGDILDYVDGRETNPAGGDRFAILQTPSGLTAQEAADWYRFTLNRQSKFAAMYWPWVNVADPLSDNRDLLMPAVCHIAGIYARTDVTKNVAKAPAGTVDGQLRFLTGLETIPERGEMDVLYPNRINPIVSGPETGLAVWGARTISNQSDWRYINVRRMFMFIERSIYNATHWIVFENNGPTLWGRIKAQLDGFLLLQFNNGLFAGSSSSEAFRVIVDETNNTQETINAGEVVIDVAIAPSKPAEFVRFQFTQKTLNA